MSFNQKNMVHNHFKPLQTYIGSSTNNLNNDQQKPSSVKTSPKNSTDTKETPRLKHTHCGSSLFPKRQEL